MTHQTFDTANDNYNQAQTLLREANQAAGQAWDNFDRARATAYACQIEQNRFEFALQGTDGAQGPDELVSRYEQLKNCAEQAQYDASEALRVYNLALSRQQTAIAQVNEAAAQISRIIWPAT